MTAPNVSICLSPDADTLQTHAANELQQYLVELFGVQAQVVSGTTDGQQCRIVLGLITDAHLLASSRDLPLLSEQGYLLRRTDSDTMVLAGGSSAAVAWAVYELVERYGTRYLLHEDVFPDNPGAFHLPDLDETFEPVHRIRSWRQFNDLAHGPVLWSLEQQKRFINQIFKLKFNGIHLGLWPQHPMVDYQIDGIHRSSWTFLFGQKIPIDHENIGREQLWSNMPLLTHPDFRGIETFDEALTVGRRLIHGILDHSQGLGMHASIAFQPLEFPIEFRGCLQRPTGDAIQAGGLVCAETGELNNPKHIRAIEARLRAYLEQWDRVDEFEFHLPEHPHAEAACASAWHSLAKKYNLEPEFDMADLLAQAQENYLVSGGVARSEREFKSTISMLEFMDAFFGQNDLLDQMSDKKIDMTITLGGSAEQVFPFVHRVLPLGCGLRTSVDYTSSRAVRRMALLEKVDTSEMRATLTMTLQDDNVGWLPQVATENIHVLLQAMHRYGWSGYYTRYWPIGDLDPTVAYMARASWDATVSPRGVYEDHFDHTYGPASTQRLCQMVRMLEDATVILDLDFLSLFFPVPGILVGNVRATKPMPEGVYHILATYESAYTILNSLRDLPGPAVRRSNLNYWLSRMEFAIHTLHEMRLLHNGGLALHAASEARKKGDEIAATEHGKRAARAYQQAIASGETALSAAAENVRDDSDRGCLAAYYHFLVREIKQAVQDVLEKANLQR